MSGLPHDALSHLCCHARTLTKHSTEHELQLQELVRESEADVRDAELALSRANGTSTIKVDEWRRRLATQLGRRRQHVATAHRVCVSGRAHRTAAEHLLDELEAACGESTQRGRRTFAASVLVADDADDTRELLKYVLRRAGFEVRCASNGLEALIAAFEWAPAVIVMDVAMPVLDGIEATRLIKQMKSMQNTRVIAHTAHDPLTAAIGEELFDAVLRKPVEPERVVAMVRQVTAA